jgi:hypothetical protein
MEANAAATNSAVPTFVAMGLVIVSRQEVPADQARCAVAASAYLAFAVIKYGSRNVVCHAKRFPGKSPRGQPFQASVVVQIGERKRTTNAMS